MLKSAKGKNLAGMRLHKQIALGAKPKKPIIKGGPKK